MREVVTRWRSGWNLATARLHATSTSFAVPACADVRYPTYWPSNDRRTTHSQGARHRGDRQGAVGSPQLPSAA
jgi:hypothetical protein